MQHNQLPADVLAQALPAVLAAVERSGADALVVDLDAAGNRGEQRSRCFSAPDVADLSFGLFFSVGYLTQRVCDVLDDFGCD